MNRFSGGQQMKVTTTKTASFAAAIGFCLASTALAAQPVVTFGITSAGPDNLAGVFTDPYHGLIDGTTPVAAFCDDFTDDVSPPQFWQALVTNLSELPNSPSSVFYGDGTVDGTLYSETTRYIAAAILAVESLASPDANVRNDLSFALWGIFDPGVLLSTGPLGSLTQSLNDAVSARSQALLAASAYADGAAYESANSVNVVIYTPTLDNSTPSQAGNRPQEFITVQPVPEPSAWAALGFDLAGVGLIGLVFRRRQLRH
jgi:hypothetical protein